MISLSGEQALQVQIGEAIAIMADADFPDQWENLIDVRPRLSSPLRRHSLAHSLLLRLQQLTSQLTPDNFVVNNAVLQTAHSIFRRCVRDSVSDSAR